MQSGFRWNSCGLCFRSDQTDHQEDRTKKYSCRLFWRGCIGRMVGMRRQHAAKHIILVNEMMLERGGDVREQERDQQQVQALMKLEQQVSQFFVFGQQVGYR